MKRGMIKLAVLNYVAENPEANYRQIAEDTGAKPDYIRSVLSKMKISLQGNGRGRPEGTLHPTAVIGLVLTDEMRKAFSLAAERRGITAHELCRRILQEVACAGIVDAVLDDEAA